MSRLVKYDPNRATDLGARCDKCHHRPASSVSLNDETLASATNICLAIRCLRAKLSCDRIPSFGPGMAVFGGDIARVRDAFGILRRVLFTRFHHDRSDLGHTYTPARPPAGRANSEKPDLPQGFDNSAPWTLRRLRFNTVRVTGQVPEHCGLGQSSKRFRHYEPAADIASGSLANREAPAGRRRLRKSRRTGRKQ